MEVFDLNDLRVIQYKLDVNLKAYKLIYKEKSAGKVIVKYENIEDISGWFIGIELNQKSRNKGIGKFAIIKILYKNIGLKIYANVRKNNIPSRKILEAVGFEIFSETKSGQLIYCYAPYKYDFNIISEIVWEKFYKSVLVDIVVFLGNPAKKAIRIPYKKGENDFLTSFKQFCYINQFYYYYDDQYIIISKLNNVKNIHCIDISDEKHVEEFGILLGYPECCTEFMGKYDENDIDLLEELLIKEREYIGFYKAIDFSDYYNGIALISHIPCSSICNNSLMYALLTGLYLVNNNKIIDEYLDNLAQFIDNIILKDVI
ncbi:GNAT family protein [Lysinibacillus capsici]|uniref:GNAT family N-acetyltransferase n=1 Tax=Lysinibacillus capsici TaxID=2115968 RepID=UPI00272FC38A|nr:GNAT family protein [Lysinibacillus capsici]MDP1394452.1 GNAT family protein [Lysinibacillus capsici]MDP1414878.1 GNAT family protein [Lysinibacillus capsici]MDP1430772.1 GNAT family protein [Lysinibacillus capsici]